jgi:hypothetical protein
LLQVQQRLEQNLQICLDLSQSKHVVFTGGLDSGLLAFMAHHCQQKFTAVISSEFKEYWKNLPFPVCYAELQQGMSGIDDDNVKPSFYQKEHTQAITGFFGDTSMLHHGSLYGQSVGLTDPIDNLYDENQDLSLPKFKNEHQLRLAIVKLSLNTKFRHWFDNFEIFDPYRDPTFLDIITGLSCSELVKQFGTASLQKNIIKNYNPDYLKYICDKKNNYEKFQK